MKQTAVDWLFTQIWETPKDKFAWQSILKEAKEMEKRQIQDAYLEGIWGDEILNSNEYYKKTYGEL